MVNWVCSAISRPWSQVRERRSCWGSPQDGGGQRWAHAFCSESVGEWEQQHIAAVALDQGPDRAGPPAEDQVTFPVPRHGPVSDLGGSLADVEGVTQLATSLGQPLGPRIAHRPTRTQAALQLA